MNPSWFQELDRIIHERARLSIVTLLAYAGELSFTELRDHLQMTDGNLSVHLQTLERAGYVEVKRTIKNRRSWTTCRLTERGRRAFEEYLRVLERLIATGRRGLEAERGGGEGGASTDEQPPEAESPPGDNSWV